MKPCLEIEFKIDLQIARRVLSKANFILFKIKSKALLKYLKKPFPKKEIIDIDDGFQIRGEGSEKEIIKQKKKLEIFLFGTDFTDNDIKRLVNERTFNYFKRKFQRYKTGSLKKALGGNTVLSKLNGCGILIKWAVINFNAA